MNESKTICFLLLDLSVNTAKENDNEARKIPAGSKTIDARDKDNKQKSTDDNYNKHRDSRLTSAERRRHHRSPSSNAKDGIKKEGRSGSAAITNGAKGGNESAGKVHGPSVRSGSAGSGNQSRIGRIGGLKKPRDKSVESRSGSRGGGSGTRGGRGGRGTDDKDKTEDGSGVGVKDVKAKGGGGVNGKDVKTKDGGEFGSKDVKTKGGGEAGGGGKEGKGKPSSEETIRDDPQQAQAKNEKKKGNADGKKSETGKKSVEADKRTAIMGKKSVKPSSNVKSKTGKNRQNRKKNSLKKLAQKLDLLRSL